MPPPDHDSDRPSGVTSWMVIPYFDDDVGRAGIERPVPSGKAISWLCRSIVVDGQPGGTAFRRGVPISVEIDVANWGSGVLPAAALVRLWWADPTLAFSTATFIGQTTKSIPPTGEPLRVGAFRVTIPEGASPHVCLLAQVSAPLDGASGAPNPDADRHWAQLNLVEKVETAADGAVIFPVVLGNPHEFAARSTLALAPMTREQANLLGGMRHFDIRTDAGAELAGDESGEIELPPRSARRIEVRLRLSDPPRGGPPQGYVLTQRLSRPDNEEPILTGSIGLLLGAE